MDDDATPPSPTVVRDNTQGEIIIPAKPDRRARDVKGETGQKLVRRIVNIEKRVNWLFALIIAACLSGIFGEDARQAVLALLSSGPP